MSLYYSILNKVNPNISLANRSGICHWQRRRFWPVAVVIPLMIAIVMGLIADLDSPRSGFLRVDLRSLERVEQDLRSLPSVSPAPSSDPQPA